MAGHLVISENIVMRSRITQRGQGISEYWEPPPVIKRAAFQDKQPTEHALPSDMEDGVSSSQLRHPKPAW
ncbi:hypothetical protein PAL_GLEAN10001430 [Pteropus alecto]|uniref:Uncharacterized protein n=1 Tax=Pteropus alecto TaxID=9402 RepID=L5KEH6_PTEAL|nr:hypothetical protein PAL_GLEAN10001430 [Pteropus alecto]